MSAKLKASAESVPAIDKRPWSLRLDEARSVAEIVTIEARIAAAYWRAFRDLGLRERKGGDLPRSWLRFANRQKGAQFLGSKHASHPINAMLNYAYVVEAGRLARALTAAGFALPIGFLHSDKHGRNSLVWDAIEPLRPLIDARVFKFIAQREFVRSDFPQAGRNAHRIDRAIIAELLRVSLLPWERHEDAARWMERTIARRRQTTSKGLNTQVALSLKAALAGEIMDANEVGVKRAEARPSLRASASKDARLPTGYVAKQPAAAGSRRGERGVGTRWPSALVKAMEQPSRHARRQNPSAQ